ncbi:hypothetical protein AB833_06705 [Chromatiales bacterium (ex Bugula neritina AB1)]|nr:hypothetical protein AB833_06705 [Chromatiales bacterium (ex Bugula neritina AB1)]
MHSLRSQMLPACGFLLLLFCGQVQALELDRLWLRADQLGRKLLEQGQAAEAAEMFEDSQWRGLSHYRAGNFAEAQKAFSDASDDAGLYNAGTSAAKAGDYALALEKLEQLVERNPEYPDASHNLEIVRQLLEDQQQNQQQDSSQDSSDESSDESSEQNQQESQQNGEQADGDNSQQNSDSSDGSSGDSQANENGQSNGELAANSQQPGEPEAPPDEQQASPGQAEEDPQTHGQQGVADPEDNGESEGERTADTALTSSGEISEDQQATEQWLRRIPDDPSQLLRNKIRLNHMIQHADVQDMPEPW